MALVIYDSYHELGRINVDNIPGRFVRWYRGGAYAVDGLFDIGNVTCTVLECGSGLTGGVGRR